MNNSLLPSRDTDTMIKENACVAAHWTSLSATNIKDFHPSSGVIEWMIGVGVRIITLYRVAFHLTRS